MVQQKEADQLGLGFHSALVAVMMLRISCNFSQLLYRQE